MEKEGEKAREELYCKGGERACSVVSHRRGHGEKSMVVFPPLCSLQHVVFFSEVLFFHTAGKI